MSSMIKRRDDSEAFFKPPRDFGQRDAKNWPVGPRTKARAAGNRDLNKLPREITHRCELRIEGVCIGNRFLQWCHAVKARYIVTARDWREAARGCTACHDYVDHKCSHAKMKSIILAAINRRKPHP